MKKMSAAAVGTIFGALIANSVLLGTGASAASGAPPQAEINDHVKAVECSSLGRFDTR